MALNVEAFRLSGRHQYANAAHVSKNETPERWIGNFVSTIDGQVNRGWPREQAEVYCLLGSSSNAITAALLERSDRYAACTYALNEALWRMHDRVDPAQPLYWHRTGEHSLTEDDPVWERLEEPDETGYCGVTCSSLVLAARTAQAFSERGLATRVADGVSVKMVTMESDVVCFESHPTDSFGAHGSADDVEGQRRLSTQYSVPAEGDQGSGRVGGAARRPRSKIRPKQRLLVVTCTFQPPTLDGSGRLAQRVASFAPKMACGAVLMGFGRREAFATGLDGLCDQPLLTLAEEFDRDLSWTDGEGVVHCCRDEWKYVVGPAAPLAITSLGMTRDALNAGKTAADFLREANALIWERRRMGHFSLPEANALLSMEEVLSVRLFSGPCFRPINDFLRGIAAATTGEQRRSSPDHVGLTFAATVGHLCAAIRKLADVVTPEEASTPLWAGMRGEPPAASGCRRRTRRSRAQRRNHRLPLHLATA